MNKDLFKKAIDKIEPEESLKSRIREKAVSAELEHSRRKPSALGIAAAGLAAVIALTLLAFPVLNSDSAPDAESPSAVKLLNVFSINAYAASGKDYESNTVHTPNTLTAGLAVPFGSTRIKRGELVSYTDENGVQKKAYSLSVSGDGLVFKAEGENIKRVTYTCQGGSFSYTDFKLIDSGEYCIARFDLSKELLGKDHKAAEKKFIQLWNSGALDEYKEKYFSGQNADLDGKSWGFSDSGENWSFHFGNNELFEQASQDGISVTLTPEMSQSVFYLPDINKASEYPAVPFEQLPCGIINITVEFTDGEIQTKSVKTSWNSEGFAVVEELV